MKVLKNNYKNEIDMKIEDKPYPRKLICESCHSELEYEKIDTRIGALGCVYIDCPLCGYDNMLLDEDEQGIDLTVNNIEFPTHFFHASKETGAVDVCNNKEVKECIHKAVNYFRENKDEYTWYTQYGNLFVQVYRYEGDENYWVLISNNYYDTYIPFESEDY